jgi:hypothetical protein
MYYRFEKKLSAKYKFSIKYKNKSVLMKILGFILFFTKEFMTKYTTTIGSTIYFPSEEFVLKNDQLAITILSHEIVHVNQANKYSKFLFGLLYLFPQCLVILAVLFPFSLWFLLFIVCLAPLPAPWRAKFETEGYTMSLFMLNEQLHLFNAPEKIPDILLDRATKIDNTYFKGSAYWFMWPFGSNLKNKVKDIENNVISETDSIYDCVRQSYLESVKDE